MKLWQTLKSAVFSILNGDLRQDSQTSDAEELRLLLLTRTSFPEKATP